MSEPNSSLILYQTEDGRTRIECRFENATVWLTQKMMAELFEIGVNTVNHHLKEIYADGELQEAATVRKYRIVRAEGKREITREIEQDSLDLRAKARRAGRVEKVAPASSLHARTVK
jgi:hypothetical protein